MTKRELKVGDRARIARWGGVHAFEHDYDAAFGTEGVIEKSKVPGFTALRTEKGVRYGHISGLDPIPDPFAPGEYVAAISFGPWWMPGQIEISEGEIALRPDYFGSNGRAYKKSSFRPATPEEIAAYKAKYEAGEECPDPTPNDDNSVGCETDEEPRITFTVGGQEFYVGQRVWVKEKIESRGSFLLPTEEMEICAISHWGEHVIARRISDMSAAMIPPYNISTTPPSPHNWKRGDWARHEMFGVGFVYRVVKDAVPGGVFVSFEDQIPASFKPEVLTFISHSEPPE